MQLESLVLDRASSLLYLTSRSSRTIYSLDTKQSSARLETFYSSSSKSPTGITIDHCTRWEDIKNMLLSAKQILKSQI